MAVRRPRPPKSKTPSPIGRGIVVAAIAVALLVVVPRLPFLSSGIHDPSTLPSRISVCDRTYRSGGSIRTGTELRADQVPIVLVDPGPFGFFTACPGPDAQGNRPCTREAQDGPCATVIYVRVGDDTFAAYGLSGGP